LNLIKEQLGELQPMAQARKIPQPAARRAHAVLMSAQGLDDKEVGKRVGLSNT
jgi:hypothetical protein